MQSAIGSVCAAALMEEAPDQVIPKLVEFLNREGGIAGAVCDSHAKIGHRTTLS